MAIMNQSEREKFLMDVHIGVLCLSEPSRGPLATPLWYDYESGGELWFVTEKQSRKAQLLDRGARISLCAQDERFPYRYVSVEGPVVSIEPADLDRDIRSLARRYLGLEAGDRYVETSWGVNVVDHSVVVRMRPERWRSADYSKD